MLCKESPSPNWKFINLRFQKFSHKEYILVIHCALPFMEKYPLPVSCFGSFLDNTKLRKPTAYTLTYRKSWCNCLWKNDPWKIKPRSWFRSEILKSTVTDFYSSTIKVTSLLGNEFLEQRKGAGAQVPGLERNKKTAKLIDSQRSKS